MVESNDNISKAVGSGSLTGLSQGKAVSKKADVSKNEFLQMLVAQLKSQDPLDPMKNDQFAVDLAQFSQVEQLISINDKLGNSSDISSLSGYLGQDVVTDSDSIRVEDGKIVGKLNIDLKDDASQLKVELIDSNGSPVYTQNINSLTKGKQTLSLDTITANNGEYAIKVSGITTSGLDFEQKVTPVGTVTGFIPGADPKLIVDGQEISPSKVLQVMAESKTKMPLSTG